MKLWRCDYEALRPVLVDAPGGWDAECDADGHPLDRLMHFETEVACWTRMQSELSTKFKMLRESVEQRRRSLVGARQHAADFAERMALFTAQRKARLNA